MNNPLGCDLYFDLADGSGPNTIVTPSGDWKLVQGRECLKQSLIRRFITKKGSWKTKPNYGAGVQSLLRKKMTATTKAQAIANIKEQSLMDVRVASCDLVEISRLTTAAGAVQRGWRIHVVVTPKVEPSPLSVDFTVLE